MTGGIWQGAAWRLPFVASAAGSRLVLPAGLAAALAAAAVLVRLGLGLGVAAMPAFV